MTIVKLNSDVHSMSPARMGAGSDVYALVFSLQLTAQCRFNIYLLLEPLAD